MVRFSACIFGKHISIRRLRTAVADIVPSDSDAIIVMWQAVLAICGNGSRQPHIGPHANKFCLSTEMELVPNAAEDERDDESDDRRDDDEHRGEGQVERPNHIDRLNEVHPRHDADKRQYRTKPDKYRP